MSDREREPFYKDKFCRAVTGFTDSELQDIVRRRYVDTVDQALQTIGRDEPRCEEDKVVDRFFIFMNAQFQLPLLNIPRESLCDAFRRFREWEEHVHPRDNGFKNHEKYWGPTYMKLDEACRLKDEEGVKIGIAELVDKIIHD